MVPPGEQGPAIDPTTDQACLGTAIDEFVRDAVRDDVFDHPETAAASVWMSMGEWHVERDLEAFIIAPFVRDSLSFTAAMRLASLGGHVQVTENAALVTRSP